MTSYSFRRSKELKKDATFSLFALSNFGLARHQQKLIYGSVIFSIIIWGWPYMMKFFRRFQDLGIEGKKAHKYDEFSRRYRLQELREYARSVVHHVPQAGCVLEIGSGPGYFSIELAKLGNFKITGLDISHEFVKIARDNAQLARVEVDFQQGNASAMSFPDKAFDFAFCSWSFKNFKEPLKVLNEMYRVLKPGATALIIDLNHHASNLEWSRYASNSGFKGVAGLFMKTAFQIQRSGAYSEGDFSGLIQKTSFEKYDVQTVGINLYVYLFK